MPLKTHVEEPTAMNLTSMIDVLFLLIMFFMVATKFNDHEKKIDINLPSVSANNLKIPESRSHTVNIHRDGTLDFDNKRVSLDELQWEVSQAKRQSPDPIVLIRADDDAKIQMFGQVAAIVEQAGGHVSLGLSSGPLKR